MKTTMVSVVVMKVVVVVVVVPTLPDAVPGLQGRHPLLALGPLHCAV